MSCSNFFKLFGVLIVHGFCNSVLEKCDNNRSYNQEHSSFYIEEDVEVPDSPNEGDCFPSIKICTRVSNEELVYDGEVISKISDN